MPQLSMHSPVGDLAISEEEGKIVSLDWGWGMDQVETPLLVKARKQLDEYFDGTRKSFDLPLNPAGRKFLRHVWAELRRIPYGQTITYGELAVLVDNVPRAMGQACGKNPIAIIIPCHRVMGANEQLTGYSGAGGIETKVALLRLEGAIL